MHVLLLVSPKLVIFPEAFLHSLEEFYLDAACKLALLEKKSDGTDVAVALNNLLTTCASKGNRPLLSCHHLNGLSVCISNSDSPKNNSSSSAE